MLTLQVNGETRQVPEGTTVGEFLHALGLANEVVAVERNHRLVPRREHEQVRLAAGDQLEIVTLVGGG